MHALRHLPPVYSRVTLRSIVRAFGDVFQRSDEDLLTVTAGQLGRAYPDRRIILCDSGTSALTLALRASCSPNAGPPVVALPAYACPDVGTAAIGADFGIMLYDVDPRTFEPDLASLRACLDMGATHVVATHLYGRLVNVPNVSAVADEFGAVVIEDAAQHAGATFDGIRGGGLAQWSVLSFGRGKGLNAGGGGALLAPNEAASATQLGPSQNFASDVRTIVLSALTELLSHPTVYAAPASIPMLHVGATRYHAPREPKAMSSASARLLLDALANEPHELNRRRALAHRYRAELGETSATLLFPLPEGVEDGALREPVSLERPIPASLLRLGVARSYPRTLAEYAPLRARLASPIARLSGAEQLARSTWTLPTHLYVSEAVQSRIITELLTLLRS